MTPQHKKHKLPRVGSTYERSYKGKVFRMELVSIKDKLHYRVSGNDFRSPSGAAKSITNTEVNGWNFWHME
jgi:hypothetical protein